jgi:AcrR family transcriptional regulator
MTDIDPSIPKSERILDAAEELFAHHGYDGVTLRQIAHQAGVDVALANYHFGKKTELFEATFFRRAQIVNDLRRKSLEELQSRKGDAISVEDIVTAFLRPMQALQLSGDRGWQNYCALVAYINSSSVWGKELMHSNFDTLISHYIAALRVALPDTDLAKLHWCYHYLSGALTLTMANTGRIDRLSEGLCQSADFQTAYDLMIPFVVAGFERICQQH